MLEPLTDKIIVEPSMTPEKTKGGIVLPDVARTQTGRGKVVSMGPGGWDKKREMPIPMPDVKPGDEIVYRSWAGSPLGQEMVTGGRPLIVIEPADVLAKITG